MTDKPVAFITGASEGLGKYLALECARRRMNLVLVALPNSNLESLASFIRRNCGVQVWVFEKDLCAEESCVEIYEAVKEQGLTVNILINNAGIGGTFSFQQRSMQYYNTLLRLNVVALTTLTSLFLDDLRQSKPAFILNVSSMAGLIPLPKKSVYGGSKAYVLGFSKSLRRELKHERISVSVLCPGAMNTTWQLMVLHRMGSWLSRQSVVEPCDVARIAIRQLLRGKEVIVPGWWNRCFLVWNRIFPKWFKNRLADYAVRKAPPPSADIVPAPPALQPVAVA